MSTPPGPRASSYDPLGIGLVRPFYRASHGDLCSDQGVNLVLANIGQVLGTVPGTLPWRPEFGSDLEGLRHRANVPALRELAAARASAALGKWDPRVRLESLFISEPTSADANAVTLDLTISIVGQDGVKATRLDFRRLAERQTSETAMAMTGASRVLRGIGPLLTQNADVQPVPQGVLTGLMRPISRGRDLRSGTGVELILSNVGQVLGTEVGTLPWLPEFGSELQSLRNRANGPVLRELARFRVDQALSRWEPRAQSQDVQLLPSSKADSNTVDMRVSCAIALDNSGLHVVQAAA